MSRRDYLNGTCLAAPHIGRPTIDAPRFGPGLNAHRLVAETAVKMAEEFWEAHMGANNDLYRSLRGAHRTEKEALATFVTLVAPNCLEDARLALADCLSKPDSIVPRSVKDEIAEALILDAPLRANRKKAVEHMPTSLIH